MDFMSRRSPPVKNSFQRELEAKVKGRKSYGSDDELASDDDRNKPGGSNNSPWAPPGAKKPGTGSSDRSGTQQRSALDDLFGPRRSPQGDTLKGPPELLGTLKKPLQKTWQAPTFGKKPETNFGRKSPKDYDIRESDEEEEYAPSRDRRSNQPPSFFKDSSRSRSKSPGIIGRKSPTDLEDIEESPSEHPRPTPRRGLKQESPRPAPRGSRERKEDITPRDKSRSQERPKSRGTPSPGPSHRREKEEEKPKEARRRSVLDLFEDEVKPKPKPTNRKTKSKLQESDSDSDTGYGSRREGLKRGQRGGPSPGPKEGRSRTPEHGFRPVRRPEENERPTPTPRQSVHDQQPEGRQSRDTRRSPAAQRDSSYCEELDREPVRASRPADDVTEAADGRPEPKAQTRKNRELNKAISEVTQAQDKGLTLNEETKESPATKPAVVRPQPRYVKPKLPDDKKPDPVDLSSSIAIRDVIYKKWREERTAELKKKKLQEAKKQKEEEEKKEKEKQEKYLESKSSYNAWVEKKKDFLHEKKRKQQKEIERQQEKEDEKLQKKKDASMAFKQWKQDKDEVLVDKKHEQYKSESRKRREEQDKIAKKRKDAKRAYESWKEKKDDRELEKRRQQRLNETKREEDEYEQQREREKLARKKYEQWMRVKEKEEKRAQSARRHQLSDEDERPAWSPASRTVAFGKVR